MGLRLTLIICLSALAVSSGAGGRNEIFAGPVEATVVRVVDGDTVDVEAHIWPGQSLRIAVRIRGVDAPELRGQCEREKAAAKDARTALAALMATGGVRLVDISGDKYFGRVVADLMMADGRRASAALIAGGLVRPYRGQRRGGWCD
jgi:endonuclease YncB( thermonuclease family)